MAAELIIALEAQQDVDEAYCWYEIVDLVWGKSFSAFVPGETASLERNGGECGGGKISPVAKALENKELKRGSEKKCLMPVNGYLYFIPQSFSARAFLSS